MHPSRLPRDTTRSSPRLPASKSPRYRPEHPIPNLLSRYEKKQTNFSNPELFQRTFKPGSIVVLHCCAKTKRERSRASLLSRNTSFLLPFSAGSRPLIHHGVGEWEKHLWQIEDGRSRERNCINLTRVPIARWQTRHLAFREKEPGSEPPTTRPRATPFQHRYLFPINPSKKNIDS